jgi:hypothetical protein
MTYWDGFEWKSIAVGSNGAVLQLISGVPTWKSSPDITGPTITINGSANMNVAVGGQFTDLGATTDEGTISIDGTVNVNSVGTYPITYSATDANGNTATRTRTVVVYKSQFNYTGSSQTFKVPAGVTSISVDAYGASSTVISDTYTAATNGVGGEGLGGRVQSTLSVTPGQTLNIYVGGSSDFNGQTGWPSAYVGWNGGAGGYKQGGGGATDIRIGGTSLAERVIVSGGGGAGRWDARGGDGGGLVGQDGRAEYHSQTIGHGGTQTAGGGGGHWHGGNSSTNQGSLGNGHVGESISGNGGFGHGGGGYYGGGGGAYNGSGGGGSSYTDPTLCNSNSVIHTQGGNETLGHGRLIITIP